jgi:serine phosphatase RsbU (regulator of sigma subunit)
MVYLCSDGYIDQNDKQRLRFSEKRFLETLNSIHHQPLAEQQNILSQLLQTHMQDTEQRDDILLVGFRTD